VPCLVQTGVITPEEEPVVRRVMQAAAFTYVAATLTSPATLYCYLFRPLRQPRHTKPV
jgi:Zn-dependent membrane protease YugP